MFPILPSPVVGEKLYVEGCLPLQVMNMLRERKTRNRHVLSSGGPSWIIFFLRTELNYLFNCLWAFHKCRLTLSPQLFDDTDRLIS